MISRGFTLNQKLFYFLIAIYIPEVKKLNEYLLLLNFVGLYFLLIANSIHSFYQSKKIYHLLELVGEGLVTQDEKKKDTMEKMIEEGMEMEGLKE